MVPALRQEREKCGSFVEHDERYDVDFSRPSRSQCGKIDLTSDIPGVPFRFTPG